MNVFVEWLREQMLACPSKHFFHLDCPGCGFQRSIIALLEGDIEQSLRLYPATIPVFCCLVFTVLHVKFDFKQGASIITGLFIFCTIVIVGFYIYKIFTHKLF